MESCFIEWDEVSVDSLNNKSNIETRDFREEDDEGMEDQSETPRSESE